MSEKKITADEMLDWFEQDAQKGSSVGILNDDNGHWGVGDSGYQNMVTGGPKNVQTTFFVEARFWKKNIREALLYYIRERSKVTKSTRPKTGRKEK